MYDNVNPFKQKAITLNDIHTKLRYALYSSANDDYVHNYDYYEESKKLKSRLTYLRDRGTYDFFKNRNHYSLYDIKKGSDE